jgi:GH25 family lysozyme M1 (1,4-beta-N-acetylmuramidase)
MINFKKSGIFALSIVMMVGNLIQPANAATVSVTLNVSTTPKAGESIVTFYGQIKPAAKAAISINSFNGVTWNKTSLKTTSSSSGSWRITTVATAVKAEGQYQAVAVIGKKKNISKTANFKIDNSLTFADQNTLLAGYGPGGHIHGTDISRWQHPDDKPIDFQKKFKAGMRFVLIKGSDSQERADQLTMRWLVEDRNAAQAAGIYTGMYHFAYLPDSTDLAYIQRDARAQAQKVIWRLASLGGYNEMDLPVALDLEQNCVRRNTSGTCTKYLGRTLVTAWAETWLETVTEKTGRKPFLYSYASFLESAMVRSEKLRQYPLWLAQYGSNPADPIAQPGLKKPIGCFVHSWSTANCSSQWQIWQYSSCGIGPKYGVPSNRLDLNVFRGTPEKFMSLVKGKWQPEPADLMPVNEPTAMNILSVASNTTNQPVEITVEVNRIIGSPVVTGTVVFRPTDKTIKIKAQSPERQASGRWLLRLTGVPAGPIAGTLNFVDTSKTHAEIELPLTLNVVQGPVLPTPTPTPKPSVSKKPVDSCAGQIRI